MSLDTHATAGGFSIISFLFFQASTALNERLCLSAIRSQTQNILISNQLCWLCVTSCNTTRLREGLGIPFRVKHTGRKISINKQIRLSRIPAPSSMKVAASLGIKDIFLSQQISLWSILNAERFPVSHPPAPHWVLGALESKAGTHLRQDPGLCQGLNSTFTEELLCYFQLLAWTLSKV